MAVKRLTSIAIINLFLGLADITSVIAAENKVLRIDLEKHFVPHQEIEELEESDEMDNILIEDMSYVQLRGMQNAHIGRSFGKLNQKDSSSLLQIDSVESENLDIDTKSEIEVDAIT
jgi:hypothetical protein